VPRRQHAKRLNGVDRLHLALDAFADGLAKILFHILAEDDDRPAEAGAPGVVDGVFHYDLTARPHRVDLLEAAVPAAHSGGHDNKRRFLHVFTSSAH